MGKSRKRVPICHIAGKDNTWKKIFNRRLRRNKKYNDIPSGNAYKKYNCSWCISDFKHHHYSYEQWYKDNRDQYNSDKECKDAYNKYYIRK